MYLSSDFMSRSFPIVLERFSDEGPSSETDVKSYSEDLCY